MQKRIVYIAHPVGGDIEKNLAKVREIIRKINNYEPSTVPFCPWYADVASLNDNDPEQRKRGLANCEAVLCRPGMIDELRLYGPGITEGMRMEIEAAYLSGIPIVPTTNDLMTQFTFIRSDLDIKHRLNH